MPPPARRLLQSEWLVVEVRLAVHAEVARVALAPLAPASEVVPAARHAIGVPRTLRVRSRHVLRVAERHLVRPRGAIEEVEERGVPEPRWRAAGYKLEFMS